MKEYGKTFAELSFAFRFLSCCSFGGFCCYFCWLSEVYRLAHKSFVACSNSRYCCLLLFFKSRWLDLQLIAALCCCCCLTLKQLTVFLLPSISPFSFVSRVFLALIEMESCIEKVCLSVAVQAISLCWVDCCTDTIWIVIYIVQAVKGLTKGLL